MYVLNNKKLIKFEENKKVWSLDFNAKGWNFVVGVLTTLAFLAVCGFTGYIE